MEELIQALRDPRAYPHPVAPVRVLETHISWVLLTGEFAYKIKKPVALEFLDFSTLAARHHYCLEELRINRRFAPGLYLDVVAISGGDSGPHVCGEGEAIEYAVRMRQFPDGAVLSERVREQPLERAQWRALGADVAALHATLPRAPADDPGRQGVPPRLRDAVAQNFRQVRARLRAAGDVTLLNLLEERTWEAWRQLESMLWRRYETGRVRECHGDLHLGNLVLLEGRAIPFDAVEFNAAFRWTDVVNEIAFLVMDCEARSQGEGGFVALNAWLEASDDHAGLGLLDFCCAYRAMVRAKVSLLAERAPLAVESPAWETYRRYVALAGRFLQPRVPFLAITCGVSGSGKSTLAEGLSGALRAIRIRSDVERKRLFGLAPDADSRAPGMPDIYTPEAGRRTFERLEKLAGSVLAAGFPVVLDATFIKHGLRERFRALAGRAGVPFHILYCDAAPEELRRRVAQRLTAGGDVSEADLAVLESQLAANQPPDPQSEPGTWRVGSADAAALAQLVKDLGGGWAGA